MSLHTLDALDAARAIREKVLSPVDLVEALLGRIDQPDAHVQAWALVDREGARAAARQAADEAARGVLRGLLHGVPFGAKDIFYSAGLRTEGGSKVMAGFVPEYDATAVARLKAAGAILLGKLHTTEFATTDPAPTRNPWNLACTPGGSSSGSAAAVAARMIPLSLGTQTIGSNVRPASYCGLVGLKPTFGRISTRGVMALSYTQDHVGLMARNVEDVALGLSIVAGHDPHDPSSSRAPVPDYLTAITRRRAPRIGVLREFFDRATPEVAELTLQAVNRLARAGATVDEAKLPPTFRVVHAAAALITRSDTSSIHAERYAQKADLYRPAIRASIEVGMLIPADLYVRALRIRHQFRGEMSPLLERYDLLLTPTTPGPAPEGMATGGSPVPDPVVAERSAVDHGALRPDAVRAAARDPARERKLHRSLTALGGGVVRGHPRPRLGAGALRRAFMSESLGQAVELLAAGDWKTAHEIVQKDKSALSSWIHGIVHILEGDLDNARGWYKRAERAFPGPEAAQAEIAAARRAVESASNRA